MKEAPDFHKHGKIDVGVRESSDTKRRRFKLLRDLGSRLIILSILAAIGILGWQLYTWQQTDVWPPARLADALAFIGFDPASLPDSTDANGFVIFCRILLDLPASLMVPILTILLVALTTWFL
ncbi:MAG TPA: hypothetical protein VI389_00975 [Geobacteraceae bacterium]